MSSPVRGAYGQTPVPERRCGLCPQCQEDQKERTHLGIRMRGRGRGARLRWVVARVCARWTPGTSEVHRRSMAVIAWPARQLTRRACCLRSARVAWWPPSPPGAVAGPRRGGSSPGRGEESREPGVTVRIGSTRRSRPGIRGRAVENGRSNRISEVWQYHDHAPVLPAQCGHRRRQAGAPVACPAGAGDGSGVTVGELDVVGLSWTPWDMIQNVRRADQARSGITDATRTERGFHAARNGGIAGQRPFRWAGMGSL